MMIVGLISDTAVHRSPIPGRRSRNRPARQFKPHARIVITSSDLSALLSDAIHAAQCERAAPRTRDSTISPITTIADCRPVQPDRMRQCERHQLRDGSACSITATGVTWHAAPGRGDVGAASSRDHQRSAAGSAAQLTAMPHGYIR